jgi:hypothetical protein
MPATVTIDLVVGPARTPFTLTAENGNIRELLAAVRDEFNIPAGATALVDGATADEDTILEDGAEVAFNKPAGQKG